MPTCFRWSWDAVTKRAPWHNHPPPPSLRSYIVILLHVPCIMLTDSPVDQVSMSWATVGHCGLQNHSPLFILGPQTLLDFIEFLFQDTYFPNIYSIFLSMTPLPPPPLPNIFIYVFVWCAGVFHPQSVSQYDSGFLKRFAIFHYTRDPQIKYGAQHMNTTDSQTTVFYFVWD